MSPQLPDPALSRTHLLPSPGDGHTRGDHGAGGDGPCADGGSAVGQWRRYAGGLAAQLSDAGCLTTDRWRRAVAGTPRHLTIPLTVRPDALSARQMKALYTDLSLLDTAPQRWWSPLQPDELVQTPPCVLAGMLELLPHPSIRDDGPGDESGDGPNAGLRVLIVSAGAGAYLPALVCAGLGDHAVVVAELDPACAEEIRRALRLTGYAPQVITGLPGPDSTGPDSTDPGRFDALLLAEYSGGRPTALTRARLAAQLAPGARMILGPAQHEPLGHGLEVHDRHGAGLWITRQPIGRGLAVDPDTDPAAVDYLTSHRQAREEVLAEHVADPADPAGLCAGCRELDIVTSAPCHLWTLADTARAHHDARTTSPDGGHPTTPTGPGTPPRPADGDTADGGAGRSPRRGPDGPGGAA